jgi:hypothetical protein
MLYILTVGHKFFDTLVRGREIESLNPDRIPLNYIVAAGSGAKTVEIVKIYEFVPIHRSSGFERSMGEINELIRYFYLIKWGLRRFLAVIAEG